MIFKDNSLIWSNTTTDDTSYRLYTTQEPSENVDNLKRHERYYPSPLTIESCYNWQLFTEVEVNSGSNSLVNNCFSIYHTRWITSGPELTLFVTFETEAKREAILFFFRCSEVNSTWLITSELANQRAQKVLLTCVVYTTNNMFYTNTNKVFKTPSVYFVTRIWLAL